MTTRQYIGARYIPVFADPVEWDDNRTYEALTMVQHVGETFMSRQAVPIGAQLPDTEHGEESTDYWVHMSNWNAQVESYRQEVLAYNGRISTVEDDLPIAEFDSENTVSKAITDIQTQIGSGFDETDNIAAVIGSGFDAADNIAAVIGSGFDATDNVKSAIEKRALTFETVSDMQSSSDLANGIVCHTNGFYASGDNGAAWYVISDSGTANGMDVISCGDMYAHLIDDEKLNCDCYGAKPNDNTFDNSPVFNHILSKHNALYIGKGTYTIESTITLGIYQKLIGVKEYATVINAIDCDAVTISHRFVSVENVTLKGNNGTLSSYKGVVLPSSGANAHWIKLSNMTIDYFTHAIYSVGTSTWDVEISFVRVNYCSYGLYLGTGFNIYCNNLYFNEVTNLLTPGSCSIMFNCCNFGINNINSFSPGTNANLVFTSCNFECDSTVSGAGDVIIFGSGWYDFTGCEFKTRFGTSGTWMFGGTGNTFKVILRNCRYTSLGGTNDAQFWDTGNPIGSGYGNKNLVFEGSGTVPRPNWYSGYKTNWTDRDTFDVIRCDDDKISNLVAANVLQTGQLVYNLGTNKMCVYNGTSVVALH